MRFRFTSDGGRYVVRDSTRPLPGYIGTVQKHGAGWQANTSAGPIRSLGGRGDVQVYDTRAAAAEALALSTQIHGEA